MERINYNSLRIINFLERLDPQNSGILFSIIFHLIILIFAVGLPNFFGPKNVFIPNVIPIEILNVTESTNIKKSDTKNEINNTQTTKQKKFNSSNNTEIQFTFGASDIPNDTPTYDTAVTFDIASDYKIDSRTSGRYLSYKVTFADSKDFALSGFDLEVTTTGAR